MEIEFDLLIGDRTSHILTDLKRWVICPRGVKRAEERRREEEEEEGEVKEEDKRGKRRDCKRSTEDHKRIAREDGEKDAIEWR